MLWQMETYFVNEKWENHTIHMIAIEKVIDGTLGKCQGNYLQFV